jgi:hypothetical protein
MSDQIEFSKRGLLLSPLACPSWTRSRRPAHPWAGCRNLVPNSSATVRNIKSRFPHINTLVIRDPYVIPKAVSVRAFITKFLAPSEAKPLAPAQPLAPAKPLAPSESPINLRQFNPLPRLHCEGTAFLQAIERTGALIKLLKEANSVTIDRIAGHIEIEHPSGCIQSDLLQMASEIYLKKRGSSKLFLAPRSPLRDSMTAPHLEKTEELLKLARETGKLPGQIGIISLPGATRPYSRLGQEPYTPLPQTIQHGDYQFFVPGPERAATVQFLASIAESSHVVLPSIVLNGAEVKPASNVSISPLWHFAALGDEINARLQAQGPLQRYHSLLHDWGNFLGMEQFDMRKTLYGLAYSFGLSVNYMGAASPMDACKFLVTTESSPDELLVTFEPAESSARQEMTICWSKHLRG